MNDLLTLALVEGRLTASIDRRVVQDQQIKYVINIKVVQQQQQDGEVVEEEVLVRMLSIKAFTDFRSLYQSVTQTCPLRNDNNNEEDDNNNIIPPLPSRYILGYFNIIILKLLLL